MNRELLEKPFIPEQIKQREDYFGKVLDYVEGHAVIQRLNDSFDGKWSFEIVRYDMLEDKDEIIVLGKLTANGIVKSQFGSSRITRSNRGKNRMRATHLSPEAIIATKRECISL